MYGRSRNMLIFLIVIALALDIAAWVLVFIISRSISGGELSLGTKDVA